MSNAVVVDQLRNGCNNTSLGMDQQCLTIRQFCEAFPWPSESAMRAYVFRAKELGITDAFVRVKRRVLVTPSKFFTLIKKIDSRSSQGGRYETTSCHKGKKHL
jgi:hypothetical protein